MIWYKEQIKSLGLSLEYKARNYVSGKLADRHRRKLVNKKGCQVVDKKTVRLLKDYSNERFGSSNYWHWLALYTEIREEFKLGWIPEDYYRFDLLEKYNPDSAGLISGYKSFDSVLFKKFHIRYCYILSRVLYIMEKEKG